MFVSLFKHIVVFISSEYKGVYKNKHYNTFMGVSLCEHFGVFIPQEINTMCL